MNITLKIATSVSALQDRWDKVLPANHHLSSRHLAAFEKARVADIRNYYLEIFVKEDLAGVAYLQQFNFQHKHLNFAKINARFASLLKIILPSSLQLLVCGHLFRINYPGYYFAEGYDASILFEAIDQLVQLQKIKPCGIMIKDCQDILQDQRCRISGYYFFDGDVTMEINRRLHWKTFDDYLKDLKKDYYKRAVKIIRAFKDVETRQLNAESILLQADQIERLYWNVVNKQTIKLGTINVKYFYEMKVDLGERFEFMGLYVQGQMVGFYTFVFYESEMETHYIGLDYEANKLYKIYFNILFAGVSKMIEKKYASLELGRTAREAKVNLGAVTRQIVNYIKVANPFVKMALNYVLKKFNQAEQNTGTQRNPLK